MRNETKTYTPEDTSEFAGVIYYLHSGDYVPRYVGKTVRPLRTRFTQHLSDARRGTKRPVCNWITKHGPENIQACVLSTFDEDSIQWIDDREIFYIAQYRDMFPENLNLTDGGEGRSGHKHSPEARAKISAANTGNTHWVGLEHTAETKQKMSLVKQGKKMTDRAKANMSVAKTGHKYGVGRVQTQATKSKISAAMSGKPSGGNHSRWHTGRGVVEPTCVLCQQTETQPK